MKTQIKQINYDGTPNVNGKWWSYRKLCDKCGRIMGTIMIMDNPNTQEKDYCLNCLREMYDNRKGGVIK